MQVTLGQSLYKRPGSGRFSGEGPAFGLSFAAFTRDMHTNTVEGFLGDLKTGIRGAYKKVSHKWLQGYLNEYAWRHNAQRERVAFFGQLLARAVQS